MKEFECERFLIQIHIGEADEYEGVLLHRAILELLRKCQYAGATVFRNHAFVAGGQ